MIEDAEKRRNGADASEDFFKQSGHNSQQSYRLDYFVNPIPSIPIYFLLRHNHFLPQTGLERCTETNTGEKDRALLRQEMGRPCAVSGWVILQIRKVASMIVSPHGGGGFDDKVNLGLKPLPARSTLINRYCLWIHVGKEQRCW